MVTELKRLLPFAVSTMIGVMYVSIDKVLIGNYMSLETLGEYSASVGLASKFLIIPQPLIIAYLTKNIYSRDNSNEKKTELIFKVVSYISAYFLVVLLFLSIYYDQLGYALLGESYSGMFYIMPVVSLLYLLVTYGLILEMYFLQDDKIVVLLYSHLIPVAFLFMSAPWITSFLGVTGVVLTIVIALYIRIITLVLKMSKVQ
jgi:O-antigen/teichoic acid export membrane protein